MLYGTGEGKNQDEAVANALNTLVSKLSISISSKYESQINTSQYSYSKKSSQNIKSEVSKIKISNYKIVKFKKIKYNKYIALVSSNKDKLFTSLKQEIDIKINKIKASQQNISNKNALNKYIFYKDSATKLNNLSSILIILKVLNKNFDDNSYLDFINQIDKEYTSSKDNLNFILQADNNSKDIASIIYDGLTNKGFKIVKKIDKNSIIIELNSNFTKSKTSGFYILYRVLDIKTKDKNTIIGSNTIKLKGSSTQNFHVSQNSTVFKLKKALKNKGIFTILGLDYN